MSILRLKTTKSDNKCGWLVRAKRLIVCATVVCVCPIKSRRKEIARMMSHSGEAAPSQQTEGAKQ